MYGTYFRNTWLSTLLIVNIGFLFGAVLPAATTDGMAGAQHIILFVLGFLLINLLVVAASIFAYRRFLRNPPF